MKIWNLAAGAAFSLALFSQSVAAAPAWYFGKITRVWVYGDGGDFIVEFDSAGLADCEHRYAYFKAAKMGESQLKSSLSMAVAAFHAGSNVGLVIDKAGAGTTCHAMSIDVRK